MKNQDALAKNHFSKLTQVETKELALIATSWLNYWNNPDLDLPKDIVARLHKWSREINKLNEAVKHLAGQFGVPQYFVNYNKKNAVWGLKYQGKYKMILYYSLEGMSVELEPNLSAVAVKKILIGLAKVLNS